MVHYPGMLAVIVFVLSLAHNPAEGRFIVDRGPRCFNETESHEVITAPHIKFELIPNEDRFPHGSQVTLSCVGYKADLAWKKESVYPYLLWVFGPSGKLIQRCGGQWPEDIEEVKKCAHVIDHVTSADSGTYSCTVVNAMACTYTNVTLSVEGSGRH